jgi:hypothetical protein
LAIQPKSNTMVSPSNHGWHAPIVLQDEDWAREGNRSVAVWAHSLSQLSNHLARAVAAALLLIDGVS